MEREVDDLREFDIGIMPMPDREYERGKCGFKAIQYMAVGVPPVVSPVGVNREIVEHGRTGFLASTEDEWVECLGKLMEDPGLRERMGRRAAEEVRRRFSIERYAPMWVDLIEQASR